MPVDGLDHEEIRIGICKHTPKVYALNVEATKLGTLSNETGECKSTNPLLHEVCKRILLKRVAISAPA